MCEVTFYKDSNFGGKSTSFSGAQKVPDFNKVQWGDGNWDDMKDDASSMRTGDNTWVRVYSKANYKGRTALIGPRAQVELRDLEDDQGSGNLDNTLESFEMWDHPPAFNTSNVVSNYRALFPGATLHESSEGNYVRFYTQDCDFLAYDPVITLKAGLAFFTLQVEHANPGTYDKATISFSMNSSGQFDGDLSVTYDMGAAITVPKWLIKITDRAIDDAKKGAIALCDGAEEAVSDGLATFELVETNDLIKMTAKVLTFCVDHVNDVIKAIFKFSDDGGHMYLSSEVSHCIAKIVFAFYQEIIQAEFEPTLPYDESQFLATLQLGGWKTSSDKNSPYVTWGDNARVFQPELTQIYGKGGAIVSVKIDCENYQLKDDHLILQAAFDPNGNLFSLNSAIDVFELVYLPGYQAPTSGVICYDENGNVLHVLPDETVRIIGGPGQRLQDCYPGIMNEEIMHFQNMGFLTRRDNVDQLVDKSTEVIAALVAAFKQG